MKSLDEVEDCNFISVLDFVIAERLNNCCSKEEIKAVKFEELKNEDFGTTNIAWLGEKQSFRTNKYFEALNLSNREVKPFVSSIKSPPVFLN